MKLTDLTLSEIEDLEQAAKMSVTELDNPKAPKGRMLRAVVFVATRRENPAFTWEDAGALSMDEAQAMISGEPDPLDESKPSD